MNNLDAPHAVFSPPAMMLIIIHGIPWSLHYPWNSMAPVTGVNLAEQLSIGNGFAAIKSFSGSALISPNYISNI